MMKLFGWLLALTFILCGTAAQAEEGKRYNFGVRPHPVQEEPEKPSEDKAAVDEEKKPEAASEKPAEQGESKPASKVVNGVYSPNGSSDATSAAKPPTSSNQEKAEQLVRFFIGTCFKYYGRNEDMAKYMDDSFPRLDDERKAVVTPVVKGTVDTQYWDVIRNGNYYILAKNMDNGKCDVIAKDGASTAIHRELKAVMDGLRITGIVNTATEYEKHRKLNKEVSIVHIADHPLVKEMGAVATTEIKDTGNNMAAMLTLFTVPQETVEIKQ